MIEFYPVMDGCNVEDAMLTPIINYSPDGDMLNARRLWQGIPAIERTPNGRLFFACYSGQSDEGIGNYVIVFKSDKEGDLQEPFMAVMPANDKTCRIFDPCLWFAPDGKLWLFVAQSFTYYDGRNGVWAMVCDNFEDENPKFSAPRRIANGIMMNKPIVYNGDWLMPCAIWDKFRTTYNSLPEETYSNIYRSRDNGKTFELLSHVDYPDRYVDEHMVVELDGGKLMMLIRGKHGIGKAYSSDGGKSWTEPEDSGLGGPCSRFYIGKLKSGRILLVNHYNFKHRDHLTAMLSEDNGKTFKGFLCIDERANVSYPDAVQAKDGRIYIIYDRERYDARELLMATVSEEDILAGELVCEGSKLKVLLNRATGVAENA